jgi:hypothetical protein
MLVRSRQFLRLVIRVHVDLLPDGQLKQVADDREIAVKGRGSLFIFSRTRQVGKESESLRLCSF